MESKGVELPKYKLPNSNICSKDKKEFIGYCTECKEFICSRCKCQNLQHSIYPLCSLPGWLHPQTSFDEIQNLSKDIEKIKSDVPSIAASLNNTYTRIMTDAIKMQNIIWKSIIKQWFSSIRITEKDFSACAKSIVSLSEELKERKSKVEKTSKTIERIIVRVNKKFDEHSKEAFEAYKNLVNLKITIDDEKKRFNIYKSNANEINEKINKIKDICNQMFEKLCNDLGVPFYNIENEDKRDMKGDSVVVNAKIKTSKLLLDKDEYDKQKKNLENEVEQSEKIKLELKNTEKDLAGKKSERKAINDDLMANIEASKITFEQLKKDIEASKRIFEQLKKDIEVNKRTNESLKKDIEANKRIFEQLKKDIETNEGALKQLQKDIKTNKETNESLKKDIEANKIILEQRKKDIETNEGVLKQLKKDIETDKGTLEQLKNDSKEKKETLWNIEREIDTKKIMLRVEESKFENYENEAISKSLQKKGIFEAKEEKFSKGKIHDKVSNTASIGKKTINKNEEETNAKLMPTETARKYEKAAQNNKYPYSASTRKY